MKPGSKHKKTDCESPFSFIREKEFRLFLWLSGRRSLLRMICAWLASFSDIFTDAVTDFGFFLLLSFSGFLLFALGEHFFRRLVRRFLRWRTGFRP